MIINIDGTNINYEIFGDGKPLLLLHGWGACINSMAPIWQFFKNNFKVYVLDFPMQGNGSDEPKVPWGVPEYSEMVKSFMQKLNISKPHVIAHSFGGRVTIYLASKYKDLFDKIVLVDAAGVKPKQTLKKRFKKIVFKCGKACLKIFAPKDKLEDKLNEYRKKHSSSDYLALKSDVMRKTFVNVINLDLTKNLKDIENPVILMWGENDTDTPLYMAHIMEKKIKDAGLVILKNAGHFSYIDDATEFNLIVSKYLT